MPGALGAAGTLRDDSLLDAAERARQAGTAHIDATITPDGKATSIPVGRAGRDPPVLVQREKVPGRQRREHCPRRDPQRRGDRLQRGGIRGGPGPGEGAQHRLVHRALPALGRRPSSPPAPANCRSARGLVRAAARRGERGAQLPGAGRAPHPAMLVPVQPT